MKSPIVGFYNKILIGRSIPSNKLDPQELYESIIRMSKDITRLLQIEVLQVDDKNFDVINKNLIEASSYKELKIKRHEEMFAPWPSEEINKELRFELLTLIYEDIEEEFGPSVKIKTATVNNKFYFEFFLFRYAYNNLPDEKLFEEYYKVLIDYRKDGLKKNLLDSQTPEKLKIRYLELIHFETICNKHINGSEEDNIKSCFRIILNSILELKDYLREQFPVQMQQIEAEDVSSQKSKNFNQENKLEWNGTAEEFVEFFRPLINSESIKYGKESNEYAIYEFLLKKIFISDSENKVTIDLLAYEFNFTKQPSKEKIEKLSWKGSVDEFAAEFIPNIDLIDSENSKFLFQRSSTANDLAEKFDEIFAIRDQRKSNKFIVKGTISTRLKVRHGLK
jgi:hypothetical protein